MRPCGSYFGFGPAAVLLDVCGQQGFAALAIQQIRFCASAACADKVLIVPENLVKIMLADKFSGFRVKQTAGAVAVRACLANTFPLSAASLYDEKFVLPVYYIVDIIENQIHVFVSQSKEGNIFNQCSRTIAGIRVIYRLFHVFEEHEHISIRVVCQKLVAGRQFHRRQFAGFIGEPVVELMLGIVFADQCLRAFKHQTAVVLHRNNRLAGRFIQNTELVCTVSRYLNRILLLIEDHEGNLAFFVGKVECFQLTVILDLLLNLSHSRLQRILCRTGQFRRLRREQQCTAHHNTE